MSPIQMKQRCRSAEVIGKGVLKGYRLVFDRWSKFWKGGVANVCMDKESQVEGVIWQIQSSDLQFLDNQEGYDSDRPKEFNSYNRFPINIFKNEKFFLECHVYVGVHQGRYDPSDRYLRRIEEGRSFLENL